MDVPLAGIAGIAACLACSAFFSGAETALTSLGRARTEQIVHEGGRRAQVLRLWSKEPVAILTTILIYNNVVNVTASALATDVADRMLAGEQDGWLSPVAAAIGVMTLLLLTFGEIVPKSLARTHSARLAVPIMRVLRPLHRLVMPMTATFVALSRALGAKESDAPIVNEADLEWLIDLGEAEGSISDEQAKLLQSVFELDDQVAGDVMLPLEHVVSVPADVGLQQLMLLLVAAGHSRVPIHAGKPENVIGVCYAKDLLRYLAHEPDQERFDVRTLARPAAHVPRDKKLDVLLREMQEDRVHLAMVVDSSATVVGIITLEDVIEELIGEVYDEHDRTGLSKARIRDLLAQSGPARPVPLAGAAPVE